MDALIVPRSVPDRPRIEPYKRVGAPDWMRGSSPLLFRIANAWRLKNREVLRIGLNLLVSVLLSASVRELVSPLCWIFFQ